MNKLPEIERELVNKADDVKAAMADLSTSFQKISRIVGDMQNSTGDPILVENLLNVRAGISGEDTRLFADASRILAQHAEMKNVVVSPETMRVLSRISAEACDEAIRALVSGQISDGDKIRNIESFTRWVREGDERTEAKDRSAYLESLAEGSAAKSVRDFEVLADEFIDAVYAFIDCYIPRDLNEGLEAYTDLDSYAGAHRDLTTFAAIVLCEFDISFRSFVFLEEHDDRSAEHQLLANAHRALRRFAEGRFGHNGGFAFDAEKNSMFSTELLDAISFLGTHSPEDLEQTEFRSGPVETLRAVEFGAGAGGMAIGLMAAGFQHRGMFESVKKRVKTLRKNWPDWIVSEQAISEISDQALEFYRGVDLVAATIPGLPFSRKNWAKDRQSEHNHFPDAIRAIRIVRPRAFLLHVVETMTFAQHAAYLAGICVDLTRIGYKVEQIRLRSEHFGLPHKAVQLVIVGIRNSERGTFMVPSLRSPITRGVSEVLGPALVLYQSPADRKAGVSSYSVQGIYDEWAKDWSRWYRNGHLPGIPTNSSELRDGPIEALKEVGIDGSGYAEDAPKVGEVTDNHLLPRLTVSAIALAQGFPPQWTFKAELGGNIDMIAEALPPTIAKAIGLNVYAALTGWKIDLDAALARPLIEEGGIGKRGVRLRPALWTDSLIIKAEEFVDGEDELEKLSDPKARAKARKKLMASIIPSKRGKGAKGVYAKRAQIEDIALSIKESRSGYYDFPDDFMDGGN